MLCPMCISLFKLPEGTWVKAGSQSQWAEYQLDSEIKAPCMTVVNAWWNSRTPTCKLVQLIIKHLWSAITDWRDEASWVSAVQVHTHWAQFRCTETAVSFYLIIFTVSCTHELIDEIDKMNYPWVRSHLSWSIMPIVQIRAITMFVKRF